MFSLLVISRSYAVCHLQVMEDLLVEKIICKCTMFCWKMITSSSKKFHIPTKHIFQILSYLKN